MLNRMRKLLKNKKGFTLVELIVVIAILGILAAVAVPKVAGFRENAESAADAANEKILRDAASMYLAENGNPASAETWDGTAAQNWESYIDEWPTGYTVTIATTGDITVSN